MGQQAGLRFVGLLALFDAPRPAVPNAVAAFQNAGVKVMMLTGDLPDTAKEIARKTGIIQDQTAEDIADENAENGAAGPCDVGWIDPKTARAIVVSGATIDAEMADGLWDAILAHEQIVFRSYPLVRPSAGRVGRRAVQGGRPGGRDLSSGG